MDSSSHAMYKKVRFADSIGQSLVSIKFVTPYLHHESNPLLTEQSSDHLHPTFSSEYVKSLYSQQITSLPVSLKCLHAASTGIVGYVMVQNISYEKRVAVRYTHDYWESYTDTSAEYLFSSEDENLDVFVFVITCKKGIDEYSVEFAVCYQVAGFEYWDNNLGRNYRIDVKNNLMQKRCTLFPNTCKDE